MTAPTLHLTNWSRVREPAIDARRVFSIMARPRAWEHGAGRIVPLIPTATALLRAALDERRAGSGSAAMEVYRASYDAQLIGAHLAPGLLTATLPSGEGWELEDGAVLCCSCSAAEARAGRCHRAWAAPHLAAAGWRVEMDGEIR